MAKAVRTVKKAGMAPPNGGHAGQDVERLGRNRRRIRAGKVEMWARIARNLAPPQPTIEGDVEG